MYSKCGGGTDDLRNPKKFKAFGSFNFKPLPRSVLFDQTVLASSYHDVSE
jgi:hypothetical protein